jgi:hypothetical protein
LNKNFDCHIYYFDSKSKCPTVPAFKKYNIRFVKAIAKEDNCGKNILIIPETYTELLYQFKHMRRAVWWLSVDNYIKYSGKENKSNLELIPLRLMNFLNKSFFDFGWDKNRIMHFAQSYYAVDYLRQHKIKKIQYLSDYINSIYFTDFRLYDRENIVLYNPIKGIEFTKKIVAENKMVKFVPLINLTNEQVKDLLSHSKVYIDFGEHPGKDRFPREAAISGCCVITGKRGAARYQKDVPINDEFKFLDVDENISDIVDKIEDCLENYDKNIVKFERYRKMIRNEESKFIRDIEKIFRPCD